ncbi:hypothetical protein KC338_g104 [Hortaea werneckii]|nr:hypothetical protein KC338_g104 [Hortaea werneckii]
MRTALTTSLLQTTIKFSACPPAQERKKLIQYLPFAISVNDCITVFGELRDKIRPSGISSGRIRMAHLLI